MASMLSLGPKLFRTRDPARDANTDMERLMSVRRAIAEAIAGASAEKQGLQRRVDLHYAQATSLLDNSGAYGERSDADEKSIAAAEADAARATARIGQVDLQIAGLNAMLVDLDRIGSAP
ncbi:MAG TPA: hypothetical protein VL147_13420 [Devosia sp.]|nr:hypothetical protein [Devosia sp.]